MTSANLRPISDADVTADSIGLLFLGVSVAQAVGQIDRVNVPSSSDWIAERFARVNGAIAFLKVRGILVTPINREARVRQYLVTGRRYRHLAEDVVELACSMGWEASK